MSGATSTSRIGAQPGLLRRLAHTPMRDIVRGRLTGRLDVRRLVAQADLPEPIRAIVLNVVQRSRLWRSEKVDVAGELIAHFADGLAAGSSPQVLAAAFGCTLRAAKLIRRAKRRDRPFVWKAWIRTVQGFGLLIGAVVVIYVVAAIRLFTGKPVLAHDYLAEVNAKASAVPETQRAWPMYRSALVAIGAIPKEMNLKVRPGHPDWDTAADFIRTHAEALALVREAASRPGLGYVAGYAIDEADLVLWPDQASASDDRNVRIGLIGVLLTYLTELRTLGRLLAVDAHRVAAMGDGTLAAANIEASLAIAEHMRETPFIINELVSLAQITLALSTLGEILADHPEVFDDAQLHVLAHRLAAVHGGRIQLRLDGEKLWFQDFVQRLYTDDGQGDGRLTAQGLRSLGDLGGVMAAVGSDVPVMRVGPMGPVAGMVIAGRREMTNEYTRWITRVEAESAKPLWEQDLATLHRELDQLKRSPIYTARYLPVALLVSAFAKAGARPQLVIEQRDAMLVAIALELYRRRSGAWPESLEQLVPDLLPAVPPDRFDGRPIRYRLVDGKPLLYSIGADRDDDGGRPPGKGSPRQASVWTADPSAAVDCDWVLWPPVPEARSPGRTGG